MIKVHVAQDDDGHWYVIPFELKDRFNDLLYSGLEEDEDYFIDEFSEYMTGGALPDYFFVEEL